MFFSTACATTLVPGILYWLYWLCKKNFRSKSTGGLLPATAPSIIPVISHVLAFALGGTRLMHLLQLHSTTTAPVRFNLGGFSIFLISSPQEIREVMYNLHAFSDHTLRARFIRNVLGIPRKATDVIEADNSGSKRKSLNSSVPPCRRIIFKQQCNLDTLLTLPTIKTFVCQTSHSLDAQIAASGISEAWVSRFDLYTFTRDLASTAIVNALCGPQLLNQCPHFIESFWEFDKNIHWLHIGVPRILRRGAYRARSQCLEAVREWQKHAVKDSKGIIYPDALLWDEIWGMKMMRNRKDMYEGIPEFDDRARAGADLGLIWACMDNLVPMAYWLLNALIASPAHLAACMPGIDAARLPPQDSESIARFDTEKLAQHSMLLSMLHEVFRLHVTSLIARQVEHDVPLGQYELPKGSMTLVVPWLQHHSGQTWESRTGAEQHPASEFWAERFLCDGAAGPEFSTKGLGASFRPFGEGQHVCPGRRFAIRAILTIVATLVSVFEFAPLSGECWRHAELQHDTFGYTPARPAKARRFCVRRRDVRV